MIIKNIKIVTLNEVIENGYIEVKDGLISNISSGKYIGNEETIDGLGKIAMPGFIDIHTHGSCGIDFMDAVEADYKQIEEAFYEEGITSFLATTLTSDLDSMKRVCKTVNNVKNDIPSLLGVHLEGPYINKIYKGAQNEAFIREPNVLELKELIEALSPSGFEGEAISVFDKEDIGIGYGALRNYGVTPEHPYTNTKVKIKEGVLISTKTDRGKKTNN